MSVLFMDNGMDILYNNGNMRNLDTNPNRKGARPMETNAEEKKEIIPETAPETGEKEPAKTTTARPRRSAKAAEKPKDSTAGPRTASKPRTASRSRTTPKPETDSVEETVSEVTAVPEPEPAPEDITAPEIPSDPEPEAEPLPEQVPESETVPETADIPVIAAEAEQIDETNIDIPAEEPAGEAETDETDPDTPELAGIPLNRKDLASRIARLELEKKALKGIAAVIRRRKIQKEIDALKIRLWKS